MRTEANRHKINRLYILGAGSSYSLTTGQANKHVAPLDIQFCNRINELQSLTRPRWVIDAAKRIKNEYLHHSDFKTTGLEELISQQISDYGFLEAIHPRRRYGKRLPSEYLNDLTHLITYVLRSVKPKNPALLEAWLTKYIKGTTPAGVKNRIISFNYDTLIDNVLLDRFSPQELYFDNICNSESSNPSRLADRYPILLKLHGSINWRCREEEYKKILDNSGGNDASNTTTYNTSGCHYIDKMWLDDSICKLEQKITPLIIPPLPQKPITSVAIFRYLWTYAYEYLYEARNLVIVGYSLPPTDTLAVSLFSKFKNKNLRNITIVDPNQEVIGKWIKLFRRNGVRAHEVKYYPDFVEYIEKET